MKGKEKMKLEEIGPYVYKEHFIHDNVTFNNNGTVSYIPRHPLIYQPELSAGRTEEDIFMLPNIALLVSDFFYILELNLFFFESQYLLFLFPDFASNNVLLSKLLTEFFWSKSLLLGNKIEHLQSLLQPIISQKVN